MSGKKRKGQSPWSVCDNCNVTIAQKDALTHNEKFCPPNLDTLIHPYISDGQLHSNINFYQLQDKTLELIPKESRNDFAVIPCHALQLSEIPIGDPVLIKSRDNIFTSFVKIAWPIQEKSSDLSVALSNETINLNKIPASSPVIVSKIQEKVLPAKTIVVTCNNEEDISFNLGTLLLRVQNQNVNKIYLIGNKIILKHYGSQVVFEIVEITTFSSENEVIESNFYLTTSKTKWELKGTTSMDEQPRNLISKLGGLDTTISELKDIISLGLSGKNVLSGIQITKGILIYGPPGTGKSTLIKALAENFTHNVVVIECARIFSKILGETEKQLQYSFEKAKQISPSVILIDDLDILCARSNTTSEFEKRVTATLSLLMDKLNCESSSIVVLATTSKIDHIEKMLRSPNRFGKEVEIYVPTSSQRYEIMNIILADVNHNLSDFDIKTIADSSHGFVGADLVSLVSKALLRNYKDSQGEDKVSLSDFEWALSKVKPSAMKEIMIEVPNVKWTDIGGQDELKLKLRQCVEWPLKYSESFKKLGITPPKGVLMFGPPGCSKTMIAKALATESKLNFISVKGPELFSKWVGESEKAVRKVFRRARQTAPSIIFFDELDAIGGERNISSGSDVQERVLAQLLTELDGVESLDNVTVIAATNRLDRIDPALIRPGRLDRIIYVPLPDSKTRYEIFTLQLQKTKVSGDVIVDELIKKTEGYSGAEIAAVCREAALKALEENIEAEMVTRKHFLEALTIVVPRTPKTLLEMYEKYLIKQ